MYIYNVGFKILNISIHMQGKSQPIIYEKSFHCAKSGRLMVCRSCLCISCGIVSYVTTDMKFGVSAIKNISKP